jgi:hypothetical protein
LQTRALRRVLWRKSLDLLEFAASEPSNPVNTGFQGLFRRTTRRGQVCLTLEFSRTWEKAGDRDRTGDIQLGKLTFYR